MRPQTGLVLALWHCFQPARLTIAAIPLALLMSGCTAATDPGPGPASVTPRASLELPAIAAAVGQQKTVTDDSDRSATVTLNKVRYASDPSGQQLVVVDMSISGVSSTPFNYSEQNLAFAFADTGSPYTHHDDDHLYGPDPTADYTPYLPPNPLRVGTVTKAHTVRGLVILRMGSSRAQYVLYLADGNSGRALAAWSLSPP